MYNFSKKQKIILGIIIAIIVGFVCYYVYAREEVDISSSDLENNLENNIEKQEFSDDTILVHISGAVNKEGMVELKINSRISDAIDKAEGVREDASIEDINLAYKLEDGMKIYIPTKQEKEENKKEEKTYITTESGIETIQEKNTEEVKTKNSKVNINTATQTQLETLPGIGPSTAIKILEYRKEKGKFKKIDELKEVSGIGEAKFNKVKELISI